MLTECLLISCLAQPAGVLLSDATASSGIAFSMTCGNAPSRHILEVNGGGVALFDYDRDGYLDLFLANGSTLADPDRGPGSRLYHNNGDGSFTDATSATGIALTGWAMGIAIGDVDDDGWEDAYVTCFGPNVLLRNEVGRRFAEVTEQAGVGDERWGTSAAFGDVDEDGDLDLYVANYLVFDATHPPSHKGSFKGMSVMPGPAGLLPQQDALYRNAGNGRFVNVTGKNGCLVRRPGYGLGVAMLDFDADGRQDILVGNDSTENFLFHNVGHGRFEERAPLAGVATNADGAGQACMGIGIADVDGNGLPDVFVTNFSNDTNTLYTNLGNGLFDDSTSRFGLGMSSLHDLSWGTGFYDFDLDGDEDLFVANGHVFPEATLLNIDSDYEQPPALYERRGGRFHRTTDAGLMFKTRYRGRATAFGDLDDDGDVDIVMTTLNGPVHVFRNEAPPRSALVVQPLRTTGGAALGSMIEMTSGDRVQRRWIDGGSFQSSDAPIAYFGLADAPADTRITVKVTWSGGEVSEFKNLPINRRIVVQRGQPQAKIVELTGRRAPSVAQPQPNDSDTSPAP